MQMQTQMQMQMLLPFAWGGISASDELGLHPPPLAGEGRGGGKRAQMNLFACPLDLLACPLPIPPPQAGEGTHGARGDAFARSSTESVPFTWSGISASGELGLHPPPRAGEGTHRARDNGCARSSTESVPFTWSGISASDELGLHPPPLAGEGWGGGKRVQMNLFACRLDLVACPLPSPPPQAGEGIHRVRGDAFAFDATQFPQGGVSSQTLLPTAAE
jgi:hypothetical protein